MIFQTKCLFVLFHNNVGVFSISTNIKRKKIKENLLHILNAIGFSKKTKTLYVKK